MVYVFLAEGFEELEALAPVDILRRGGVDVKTAGIKGKTVTGAHGIPVTADINILEITDFSEIEAVMLPGGMPGTVNLEKDETLSAIIDYCYENGKILSAICAAPSILGHKGFLKGKKATCFDGFEKDLIGAETVNSPVVTDGNIITAFGAGAAFQFGFKILEALKGTEKSENIRKSMKFGV